MKKAELMRDALTRNNTWCKANPELFIVWVEKGHIQIEATGEASFMYHYTIQVLVVDFPGQIDDLMLPLLAWAWQQQPDLLLNPDNNRKVEFDADIINDDVADILFKVPAWERVMVTKDAFGKPKAEHLAESRPRFNGGEWETVFDPESGGLLV
ncbi:TPA: phage tail protein [Klebsiella variicola]|uniref:phage tail protein n=1 Tax=Klebsiella variicola TaxID=244366 RepID=UPI001402E56F|nr:phage tail protein [Klebsiella variicola]EKU9428528.1 phage tail protein [Klebsiella variicola]MDI0465085.1 phage tail protein [Klebsiella variicola]